MLFYFVTMRLHVVINHALILSAAIINLTAPVCAKKKKQGPIAPRVMTVWWGLFNKPSECKEYNTPGDRPGMKCGMEDIFDSFNNSNLIQFSSLYGAGKDSNVACSACTNKHTQQHDV